MQTSRHSYALAVLAAALTGTLARFATAEPPAHEPEQEPEQEPEPAEIVVVGSRVPETPGSVHVIGRRQLERFEYDDPHAVLQQVPGVYVRQEDGVGLRPNIGVRGGNPDRSKKLTLMEDGILFGPAPYSAPAAYYFPLLTRMGMLRVVKGPAAIAFGPQTIGGAVDLITRPIPADTRAAFDLGIGEYGYLKGHGYFGASTERFGFLVEGVHLHSDGFKELPSGADTGFVRNEWMVKGSYVVDPTALERNELRLKLTYSDEASNETYLGLTDRDFRENPYRRYAASNLDRMDSHRTSVVLSHVFESPRDSLLLTTSLYRHDYHRVWRKLNGFLGASVAAVLAAPEEPANAELYAVLTGEADSVSASHTLLVGPNARTFVSQGAQTLLEWRGTTGPVQHRLEVGTRLHRDSIERNHTEDAFLMIDGDLVPAGEPTLVTTANRDASSALALHVLDVASWQHLSVTLGVRAEAVYSTSRDDLAGSKEGHLVHALMPGAGLYYGLTDALGVLAGVYRGFSPPPPGSAEDVEPERSLNYEAGARWTSRPLRLEAVGFFNDYSNLTHVCTFSSGCLQDDLERQFDAGEAHIYGVEGYGEYQLRTGPVTVPLSGAYTYTRARFRRSFESGDPIWGNVRRGDELPYVPRHQANATIGFELERLGCAAAMTYVAAMREDAGDEPLDETVSTDRQLWFDVSAHAKLVDPVVLYLTVRNLLDSADVVSRRPFGARPNAPRWVQVGAKVGF